MLGKNRIKRYNIIKKILDFINTIIIRMLLFWTALIIMIINVKSDLTIKFIISYVIIGTISSFISYIILKDCPNCGYYLGREYAYYHKCPDCGVKLE